MGEAKASGNLGNTLKVLGRFDEAVICCQRHLDISRDIGDKVRRTLRDNVKLHEVHSCTNMSPLPICGSVCRFDIIC